MSYLPLAFMNLLSDTENQWVTRFQNAEAPFRSILVLITVMVCIWLAFAIIWNIRATFNAKADTIKS